MKLTVVESTSLATVAYDANRELLQIEFRDRTIYRYRHVPADVVRSKYSNVLKTWVDGATRSERPWENVRHQFWTV